MGRLRSPHLRLLAKFGLWRAMAWGIAVLAIWDGAGYFAKGNSIAQGPGLVVLRDVPFGLHLHGAIMLILASAIIYSSHDRPEMARITFLCVFAYSIWVSTAVIAGWMVSHHVTWSSPSKWFLIAWISLFLAASTDHMKFRAGR